MLHLNNPLTIEDSAALLFWNIVQEKNYKEACEIVLSTHGHGIFSGKKSSEILMNYGLFSASSDDLKRFCTKVANHAYIYTKNKVNMIGVVYQDDLIKGLSPSASKINLAYHNISVRAYGSTLEKLGRLCLRTPLPSVVIADSAPSCDYFQVKDTLSLGYEYPVFMAVQSLQQLENGQWLILGIFHLPENIKKCATPWSMIIPNSLTNYDRLLITTSCGKQEITYVWAEEHRNTREKLGLIYRKINGLISKKT